MSVLLIKVCFSSSVCVFVCEKSPLKNLPVPHYWNSTPLFLLFLRITCNAIIFVKLTQSWQACAPCTWTQRRPLMGLHTHMFPRQFDSQKWRANGIDSNLFFLKCQVVRQCFLQPFGPCWAEYWRRTANRKPAYKYWGQPLTKHQHFVKVTIKNSFFPRCPDTTII